MISDKADVEEVTESNDDTNETSGSNGVTLMYGGKTLQIAQVQVPYVLIVAASIILLFEAIFIGASNRNRAYAISVAAISLATGIAAIILSHSLKEKWSSFGIYIGYFLLLWNTIGAIILTFQGPFVTTTNAYFATWAMVMCSVVASNVKYGAATDQLKNANALSALVMSSSVLMIAILFVAYYDWRNILSLIVSVVTNVVASIFIYLDRKGDSVEGVKLPVLSLFAVLWIIVVIIETFPPGIFFLTSNGFFAAWGGCIFCVYAACTC